MLQAEFQLAHLTDFHLFQSAGAPWRAFLNKRSLSYLSWRLRRGRTNPPAVLTGLLDGLSSRMPDHVVITGDLTHMGLPDEFRRTRRVLERIGPPDRVFVIPGNHDALVASSRQYLRRAWDDYMAADPGLREEGAASDPDTYPRVREQNGVALIGLSSAVPTLPFSAAGRLGHDQRRRLADVLTRTGRQGLFRVVLVHHPILRGQVRMRKSLRDAGELRALLRRHGAELVLHGHAHRHSRERLNGPAAPIPVIGLPSSTADHADPDKGACLRIFSIVSQDGGWRVGVRDTRPNHSGTGPQAFSSSAWSLGKVLPNISK